MRSAHMKKHKATLAAIASLLMLSSAPAFADEVGYIRIGDKCYVDVGNAPDNHPVWVEFPCPREVSENP